MWFSCSTRNSISRALPVLKIATKTTAGPLDKLFSPADFKTGTDVALVNGRWDTFITFRRYVIDFGLLPTECSHCLVGSVRAKTAKTGQSLKLIHRLLVGCLRSLRNCLCLLYLLQSKRSTFLKAVAFPRAKRNCHQGF